MPADIQVRASTKTLNRRLSKLRKKMSDLEPTLDQIGKSIVAHTVERFDRQSTPTGKPWKPSKLARKQRRKTLVKSGRLKKSIEYYADKKTVNVGTDVPYAHVHQLGAYVKIKPRNDRYGGLTLSVNVRVGAGGVSKVRLKSRRKYEGSNPNKRRKFRIDRRAFLGIGKKDRLEIREAVKETIKKELASRERDVQGRFIRS